MQYRLVTEPTVPYNMGWIAALVKELKMHLTPKKWQKYWYFGENDNDCQLLHLSGLEFNVSYNQDGTFGLNLKVETIPICKEFEIANGVHVGLMEEVIKTRRFEAKRFITRHLERKAAYGNDYIFPCFPRID